VNNLPKVVTQRHLEQDLNSRPVDRKPKRLTRCTTAPHTSYTTHYTIDPHFHASLVTGHSRRHLLVIRRHGTKRTYLIIRKVLAEGRTEHSATFSSGNREQ